MDCNPDVVVIVFCALLCRLVNALPQSFDELIAVAQKSADGKETSDMAQWRLHQDLIMQQFASLLASFEDNSSQQVSHLLQGTQLIVCNKTLMIVNNNQQSQCASTGLLTVRQLIRFASASMPKFGQQSYWLQWY